MMPITRRPLNMNSKSESSDLSNVVSMSPVNRNTRKDKNGSVRPTAFQPGQSGNPTGRPKTPAAFNDLMKEYSVAAARKLLFWAESNDPKVSPAACMYILNRAYGSPVQMTEVSGPNGSPFQAPSLQVNFVAAGAVVATKTIDIDS